MAEAGFADDLASFVRKRRKAEGLNQTELALLAGVGRRFVRDLEAAKPTLHLDKVEEVLAVFGRGLGVVRRTPPPRDEGRGAGDGGA